MSLVGPRPLITEEDRLFSGWQRRRYDVAPGITGPWQILGSSRVPVEDMLTLDYLYCSSWSLWLDAKILARTLPYVLSRRSGEHTHRPALAPLAQLRLGGSPTGSVVSGAPAASPLREPESGRGV